MRAKVYFHDNGLFTNKIINTSDNNSLSFHNLLINTLLFPEGLSHEAKSLRPDYTATLTFDVGDLGGQRIVGTLLNVFLILRILLMLLIA